MRSGAEVVLIVERRKDIGNSVDKWWLPVSDEHRSERQNVAWWRCNDHGLHLMPMEGERGDVPWL